MRCLGKAFNSRGGDDSMEGVKFVGSRFSEVGLDAQFTTESMI